MDEVKKPSCFTQEELDTKQRNLGGVGETGG